MDLPTSPTYCCYTTLRKINYDAYICQQDSALARLVCQMIELLQRETSKFIRPQNSHDRNPVNYQIWGLMQDRVYQMPVEDVADLRQHLINTRCKALSTIIIIIIKNECHNNIIVDRLQGCGDDAAIQTSDWMKKEVSWTIAVMFRQKCSRTVYKLDIFYFVHW